MLYNIIKLKETTIEGEMILMYSFYDEHGKECMCDMIEEQTNEPVCDDFSCLFAGTKLCVEESCNRCKLNNCRGCRHLFECFYRVEQD